MKKLADLVIKLGNVDRRWIFIIIAIVVMYPLFKPLGLPIRPTASSQQVYNVIDALPEGSKVLLSCEYGPSTKPEIHPMVIGVLRHLFPKIMNNTITTCAIDCASIPDVAIPVLPSNASYSAAPGIPANIPIICPEST